MRKIHVIALTCSGLVLSAGLLAPSAAFASGRPGGDPVTADGKGSLGTPWTLKSQHDDDGPGPVVGEEFEINTEVVGDVWDVTYTDNGIVTFTGQFVSTATGVRVQHASPDLGGTQQLAAHAVDETTGEVIEAVLPPLPPAPGHGGKGK
jgi:hypothetical protein